MARTKRKCPPKMFGPWIGTYDPTRDHSPKGNHVPGYLKPFLPCGPGGYGCPCCFDAPGSRKARIRAAKKAEKRKALADAMRLEY